MAPLQIKLARRLWPTFRLRTLLFALTLLALWLGNFVRQAQLQQAAVATIQAEGGTVAYDYAFAPEGGYICDSTPPGPDWLWERVGHDWCFSVVRVYGGLGTTTNDTLRAASQLGELRSLYVSHASAVDDRGLKHLKTHPRLEQLSSHKTAISDAAAMAYMELHPGVWFSPEPPSLKLWPKRPYPAYPSPYTGKIRMGLMLFAVILSYAKLSRYFDQRSPRPGRQGNHVAPSVGSAVISGSP